MWCIINVVLQSAREPHRLHKWCSLQRLAPQQVGDDDHSWGDDIDDDDDEDDDVGDDIDDGDDGDGDDDGVGVDIDDDFQAWRGDPDVRPPNLPHPVPENSCGQIFIFAWIVSRTVNNEHQGQGYFLHPQDLDADMERLVGEAAREAPTLFYYTQCDLDKSVQM